MAAILRAIFDTWTGCHFDAWMATILTWKPAPFICGQSYFETFAILTRGQRHFDTQTGAILTHGQAPFLFGQSYSQTLPFWHGGTAILTRGWRPFWHGNRRHLYVDRVILRHSPFLTWGQRHFDSLTAAILT
jgi:hypothetical protein